MLQARLTSARLSSVLVDLEEDQRTCPGLCGSNFSVSAFFAVVKKAVPILNWSLSSGSSHGRASGNEESFVCLPVGSPIQDESGSPKEWPIHL